MRKGGNRVRITAQLIDAATGNHIWADRYDGDLTDVFALQDEITKKVVAAIEPKLLEAEGIRSQNRSPEDLGAWDMVIQANSLFWRLTKAEGEAAIAILKQAVERYPDYAPAHSMLAFMMLVSGYLGWSVGEREPQVKQAAALAARAAELDDSDPWAHLALGYVALHDAAHRRGGRGIPARTRPQPELRRRPRLSRLGARARRPIGPGDRSFGASHPHEPARSAKRHIQYGRSPCAHYLAGRYTEAIDFGRKALQQRDGMDRSSSNLRREPGAGGSDRRGARGAAAIKGIASRNVDRVDRTSTFPIRPSQMPKFLEGMRKAGLE